MIYKDMSGNVLHPTKQNRVTYLRTLPAEWCLDKGDSKLAEFGILRIDGMYFYQGDSFDPWAGILRDGDGVPLSAGEEFDPMLEKIVKAGACIVRGTLTNLSADLLARYQITTEADPEPTPPTPPTLEQAIEAKKSEIDSMTDMLLRRDGFQYGGKTFGAHPDEDGKRWAELGTAHALGLITFPINVYAIDSSAVSLADANALLAFIGAYMAGREAIMEPGRQLKQAAAAATSLAEVAAITDSRE